MLLVRQVLPDQLDLQEVQDQPDLLASLVLLVLKEIQEQQGLPEDLDHKDL